MKFLSILAVLAFFVAAICEAGDENLMLYFPFDEGSGDEVRSLSPKMFVGRIDGAIWVDGVKNKGLEFDGWSNVAVDPMNIQPEAFTIEFWFKPAEKITSGTPRQDMIYRLSGSGGLHLTFDQGDGKLGFHILLEDGEERTVLSQTQEWETKWYHVAAVQDSTKAVLYINGILEGEVGTGKPPDFAYGQEGMVIGGRGAKFAGFFKGCIDEFRIWNVALTEQEVQDLLAVELNGKLLTLWGKVKSVSP